MKNYCILVLLLILKLTTPLNAQDLRVRNFGNKDDQAVVFLHGGPGYNSVVFEQTTAPVLAEQGYFVISYDRRGEGRNSDLVSSYNFEQSINDLKHIADIYAVDSFYLVGHSFGGIIATKYATKYPEQVIALVLVSTPISMQETLKGIIVKSKEIYERKSDDVNLGYINLLENMDTSSLEFSSYTLMHAMQNGFYKTSSPTSQAIKIYGEMQSDSLITVFGNKQDYRSPGGFWDSEKYTTVDISNDLKSLVSNGVWVYGLYGKDDGLFTNKHIAKLGEIIGNKNLTYADSCSHNFYIDRQRLFMDKMYSIGH